MNNEWRKIRGYENYEVSTAGEFRRTTRLGKLSPLRGKIDQIGYQQIGLVKNGYQQWFMAHRVVAATFIPLPETNDDQYLTVNHKNRNKTDNRVENLEFVTMADNHRHWRNMANLEAMASR